MTPLTLPARPRILVVALRRLGDVLLTTTLIRTLQRAWPDAEIDALVFADTAGILAGNPDLHRIVTMRERPGALEGLRLAARLLKRYALAVSSQSGDRPTLFASLAGRVSIGPSHTGLGGRLKKRLLDRDVPLVDGVHRIEQLMRLADALGIARVPEVVCPAGAGIPDSVPHAPYAVVHAAPMFRYKRWTIEGWRAVAAGLGARGYEVVATGGPGVEERRYADALWSDAPNVRRLDGQLGWPSLAATLAGARIYVGPDTSVTHLAAASGCPTVALFGPTDPRIWGPWPAGGLQTPWSAAGTIQRRGNVWLVQNPLPCLPCQQEGCERRLDSYSRCLDELTSAQVFRAIDQALAASDTPSDAVHSVRG
ncbi:MAG TPA: glycosyltransferase family 9 protein [Vicinamibacterales bacterium]|nr:glycosyltransferase family 9 protein [Vicinamibacterales bacterium]